MLTSILIIRREEWHYSISCTRVFMSRGIPEVIPNTLTSNNYPNATSRPNTYAYGNLWMPRR